jgi:hypothetical protein
MVTTRRGIQWQHAEDAKSRYIIEAKSAMEKVKRV